MDLVKNTSISNIINGGNSACIVKDEKNAIVEYADEDTGTVHRPVANADRTDSLDKKRVLFLIPTLHGGGAERVIVTLLRAADREKFRMSLAVINIGDGAYLDDLPDDIEFIDLGYRRLRYALPAIIALIWKRRPDIVFSTLGHLNLALAMLRPVLPNNVRYVAREAIVLSKALYSSRFQSVRSMLYRLFYKNHDRVVCQSIDMQNDLISNFGLLQKKTVLINNPVDINRVQEMASQPADYPCVDSGTIRLIAAGRLVKQKGYDLLIEAIASLNNPCIHLTILGEGPIYGELKQLAERNGIDKQVYFAGFQSNPYAWFSKADAFILSSHFEGFPNVVLEALACGTPVIATPAPGGVREILENIDECIIANDISKQALANAINQFLARERVRVPTDAVARYGLDRILSQYSQLFLE